MKEISSHLIPFVSVTIYIFREVSLYKVFQKFWYDLRRRKNRYCFEKLGQL